MPYPSLLFSACTAWVSCHDCQWWCLLSWYAQLRSQACRMSNSIRSWHHSDEQWSHLHTETPCFLILTAVVNTHGYTWTIQQQQHSSICRSARNLFTDSQNIESQRTVSLDKTWVLSATRETRLNTVTLRIDSLHSLQGCAFPCAYFWQQQVSATTVRVLMPSSGLCRRTHISYSGMVRDYAVVEITPFHLDCPRLLQNPYRCAPGHKQ